MPQIKIKKLNAAAVIPKKAHPSDAGFDVCAVHNAYLAPGARSLIKTGIAVAIPVGYEIQVRSRSGLANKFGVMVLNSPGTIDANYRGEIGVILHNTSDEAYSIELGDRIAQLVCVKLPDVELCEVEELDETDRGAGGFGSTGTSKQFNSGLENEEFKVGDSVIVQWAEMAQTGIVQSIVENLITVTVAKGVAYTFLQSDIGKKIFHKKNRTIAKFYAEESRRLRGK